MLRGDWPSRRWLAVMLSSFPGGSSFPRHRSVAWREGLALEGSNVIPSHACVPGLTSRMGWGHGHEALP